MIHTCNLDTCDRSIEEQNIDSHYDYGSVIKISWYNYNSYNSIFTVHKFVPYLKLIVQYGGVQMHLVTRLTRAHRLKNYPIANSKGFSHRLRNEIYLLLKRG